jgi:hypothetical protein
MLLHDDKVLIGLDFRSAFQSVNRPLMLQAVRRHAPWLSAAAEAWYGGDAEHTLHDEHGNLHTIKVEKGVDQGCPLGALLFAIAIRDAAHRALDIAHQADPDASLLFYLDDGFLLISAEHSDIVLSHLINEFSNIGISLNLSKLQVRAPCGLSEDALPQGLKDYRVLTLNCLGKKLQAPGDGDHEGLQTDLTCGTLGPETERLESLTSKWEQLVSAGLPIHVGISLLRAYAGPSVQYALRTSLIDAGAADQYDIKVAEAWSRLLKTPVDHQSPRLWLPARLGGMGAFSARKRAAASAWSAWTLALPDVLAHLGQQSPEELFLRVPALAQQLGALHERLVEQGAPMTIAGALVERAIAQPVRISRIMGYIHKRDYNSLKASLTNDRAGLLRSAGGPGAGAFLEPPCDDRYTMANERFVASCRRRLGDPWPQLSSPPASRPLCRNVT